MAELDGRKIAILATNGFEQDELAIPLRKLREAGAEVEIVSPESGEIRGWKHADWGDSFPVDRKLSDVRSEDYDALVLPGGQINPDLLRVRPEVIEFVKEFYNEGKTVAAVCHAPWLLIEAGLVKGRRATSYHSVKTDMKNAGANWVDEAVVIDNGIVTSRNPNDLNDFVGGIIHEIQAGEHPRQKVA
jgi:protease I